MDFSSDDYFGTLGGSLMKDLLADLQVDDNDFSLEQLEKELASLDREPPQLQPSALPALDAASLVVSHAQERSAGLVPTTPSAPAANEGMDAWSLSLQNFTAMSLQDDFLAADSARKQQQQSRIMPSPGIKPTALDGAEDYDIGERPALAAPPGLGGSVDEASMAPPQVDVANPPNPKKFPRTPQNSLNIPGEDASKLRGVMSQVAPMASPNPIQEDPQAPVSQSQPVVVQPPQMVPPPAGMIPLPMAPPIQAQPVLVGMPTPGPAWQTPQVRSPPPIQAFCNPHPAAQPIPAATLESKLMTSRDIAYVVHAILKPVLAQGVSENDYDIQFLRKLGGAQGNPANPKQAKDISEEMASRAAKTKEWSSEKGTLGHVAKTNVARPRALIATPQTGRDQDSEQKQRASLWKARIYCDQAYQSYQLVVDIWRSAPPGGIPPQVQLHLAKLMKCMGITLVDKEYQVDSDALGLLVKLSKGRALISRILDQALLPPNAVQAALPPLIFIVMPQGAKREDDYSNEEHSTERLFRSIAGVVQKLNISSDTLLKCVGSVQEYGKNSLSSTARMECVHTLLQKGSMVLGKDPSEETRAAWGEAERNFMSLLQAF